MGTLDMVGGTEGCEEGSKEGAIDTDGLVDIDGTVEGAFDTDGNDVAHDSPMRLEDVVEPKFVASNINVDS